MLTAGLMFYGKKAKSVSLTEHRELLLGPVYNQNTINMANQ